MATGAAAHTRTKSDAERVQDNVKDLGEHVGKMASSQYGHAQDMATDAIQEAGEAIQRNPFASIGIGLGVGFALGLLLGGRS
jgi:ElaB/YqjD/DUF883 family membrane-anchored ribosome-binding protein